MTHHPDYEGRPLTDPNDELVDQGLQFDVATLMKRRGMLNLMAVGAGTISLAACGQSGSASTSTSPTATQASASTTTSASSASGIVEIPEETAGPYPGDGSNGADVLEQSGVVRSDIRSSFGTSTTTASGVPMTLELDIVDMAGGNVPFKGVAVYVWHCTADGKYSMYSEGITNENFLRGVQIADENGKVKFTSIFPGCYSGRWPHIHFEVYPDQASIVDAGNKIATSQVALPKSTCEEVYATNGYDGSAQNLAAITLASDNVFGDDEGAHQLGTVTGDVNAGYTVYLQVGVDTATAGGSSDAAPPAGGASGGPGGRRP